MKTLKYRLQSTGANAVEYKGIELDCGYRVDMIIKDSLVVELKAGERLLPIHQAQILTYMKIAKIPLGLMVNFNSAHCPWS